MLKVVDGIGRCILFVDELEKSMNADAVSGRGDTGTSSRSFGTLLTWLSDHQSPVFVIGTSNRFNTLPPELIRKGRFDELFWIDLPTDAERREIFNVVLRKYSRDSAKFDLQRLVAATKGFTGAEIDNAVTAAMFEKFAMNGSDITTEDILKQVEHTSPLSVVNKVDLDAMRDFAKGKLCMATESGDTVVAGEALRALGLS